MMAQAMRAVLLAFAIAACLWRLERNTILATPSWIKFACATRASLPEAREHLRRGPDWDRQSDSSPPINERRQIKSKFLQLKHAQNAKRADLLIVIHDFA